MKNFLLVTYTIIQSINIEMCSLHLTHPSAHTLGAVGKCGARGALEQLGVRCLAQGSQLSHGQFLPDLRFEPTTSGYKSNALSIRPRLPPDDGLESCGLLRCIFQLFEFFTVENPLLSK